MAGGKRKDNQRQLQQQQQKHSKTVDAADDESVPKKRSRAPKLHQREEKMISSDTSSKILKEALNQQREIEQEAEEQNHTAFSSITENPAVADEEEEDIDGFDGFSETQSIYDGGSLQEIDEEDERLLATFVSENAGPQLTLADIVIQKIKEKDAEVTSVSVVNKTIEENRWQYPEVPMEED